MQFRPMTMADADKMLEWKNYSETRQYAILHNNEIKKEDHYEWLRDWLHEFQVIDNDGELCGAIRIHNKEVSVWIDRKYRNQGLASMFLKSLSQYGIISRIVAGNIASIRTFINAGFKPISFQDNYYIFQK